MTIVRQTEFLDGADWPELASMVHAIKTSAGRCVICKREQPCDVRWPAYQLELEPKDGSESREWDYRCCPDCHPQFDRLMDMLGASPEAQ